MTLHPFSKEVHNQSEIFWLRRITDTFFFNFPHWVPQNTIGRGRNFCLQKFLTGLAGLVYFMLCYILLQKSVLILSLPCHCWCSNNRQSQNRKKGIILIILLLLQSGDCSQRSWIILLTVSGILHFDAFFMPRKSTISAIVIAANWLLPGWPCPPCN